ncbi:hypothetical protein LCI18_006385 [Fusarium solani-melongenae]|uniref:Uncharacterized protein n=1 Tax=Fusarium solani subsp. cucurbitae TaxID=2747967 RepID=A0ACD3Z2L7_FUSSC|nr:hypothetical protein LCI18_006385 [Fusarium solani-melongenae]
MSAQIPESMDNGQPASRQEIHNISATNGGFSLAGNFKDCTIGGAPRLDTQDKITQCRNTLFVSHPKIDRATLIGSKGQRAPGTCEWIRENSHYQTWLAGESRLLWISGGPGRGKTVLSLFLNEEVEKACEGTQNRLLFYFCRFQDEKHNNTVNVLRSLIYQILEFSSDGPEVRQALEYFDSSEKVQFALSSFECLWTVLEKLFAQPGLPTIFCIIDGVDECHSSHQLVKKLYDYCKLQARSNDNAGLRLALIGRDIDGLDAFPGIKVDPDNEENVNEDVKRLISSSLEPLARIQGFDGIRSRVEKSLLERAEGTFLWVSFVIDELSRKKTCLEILDTIRGLPKGLDPIFARMLHQIESDQRETSALIFKWVALAKKPLTLDELTAVIGVGPGDHDVSTERITADRVAICRPFLKVHNNQVLSVHQSAKEYMLRKQHDTDQVLEGFRITTDQGHVALAHKCLLVLENSALQHTALPLYYTPGQGESPLLNYAILHWHNHARLASRDAKGLFNPDRPFFQQSSAVQSKWIQTYSLWDVNYIRNLPKTPLHMASFFAIVPWVKIALQQDRSMPRSVLSWRSRKTIDSIDFLRTPLGWAVKRGDKDTIQFLLDSGADIDVKDRRNETALIIAVSDGREPMVRFILDSGASLDPKNQQGIKALISAICRGYESITKLLLGRGVSVKGQYGPLNCAVLSEHERTVPLLLEYGADVKLGGNYRYRKWLVNIPPLIQAAISGRDRAVRLLLEHGADANARASRIFRPEDFILMSLKHRMWEYNRVHKAGSAVVYAAERGHTTTVQLLLDHGVDISIKDEDGKTALELAAEHGFKQIEELLIRYDRVTV